MHAFSTLKVMKQPWPGMARTIYGDHERFERVYFSKFNGYYTTGDGEFLISVNFYCCQSKIKQADKIILHYFDLTFIDFTIVLIITPQFTKFSVIAFFL